MPHLVLIAKAKWRNRIFKNRLRFLTLKWLVRLPEFFWKKRRFKCYYCSKMVVAETSFVKKNHQIPRIINQNIAQKLIEKTSMTDIVHLLLNFSPIHYRWQRDQKTDESFDSSVLRKICSLQTNRIN